MIFPSFSFLLLRNASGSSESFREPERSDGRILRDPSSRRNMLLWLHCLSNLDLVSQILSNEKLSFSLHLLATGNVVYPGFIQINQIKITPFKRLKGRYPEDVNRASKVKRKFKSIFKIATYIFESLTGSWACREMR